MKFLRRHAEALGYKSNTILDTDDQKLIRNIVKSEDLDAKIFTSINYLPYRPVKNKGLLPKDVLVKVSSILKSILAFTKFIKKRSKIERI